MYKKQIFSIFTVNSFFKICIHLYVSKTHFIGQGEEREKHNLMKFRVIPRGPFGPVGIVDQDLDVQENQLLMHLRYLQGLSS